MYYFPYLGGWCQLHKEEKIDMQQNEIYGLQYDKIKMQQYNVYKLTGSSQDDNHIYERVQWMIKHVEDGLVHLPTPPLVSQ